MYHISKFIQLELSPEQEARQTYEEEWEANQQDSYEEPEDPGDEYWAELEKLEKEEEEKSLLLQQKNLLEVLF